MKAPFIDWQDRMEELMADRLVRHSLRVGPLCTTKNSLPDSLPQTDGERQAAENERELLNAEMK